MVLELRNFYILTEDPISSIDNRSLSIEERCPHLGIKNQQQLSAEHCAVATDSNIGECGYEVQTSLSDQAGEEPRVTEDSATTVTAQPNEIGTPNASLLQWNNAVIPIENPSPVVPGMHHDEEAMPAVVYEGRQLPLVAAQNTPTSPTVLTRKRLPMCPVCLRRIQRRTSGLKGTEDMSAHILAIYGGNRYRAPLPTRLDCQTHLVVLFCGAYNIHKHACAP